VNPLASPGMLRVFFIYISDVTGRRIVSGLSIFLCFIAFLYFSCCEAPVPAPSVISLIDQIDASNDSESFRIIIAESRPAAFLLNGSGFTMRVGDSEFSSGSDSGALRKIIDRKVTSGLMTQDAPVSIIRMDCGIRAREKVILRLQYRKPRTGVSSASLEFIGGSRKTTPISLTRTGNHVEAILDAPPQGADGIIIRHTIEPGRVFDLTSIILLGIDSPVGRSDMYRIRAFFDRYSGPHAMNAVVTDDSPRSGITRNGEIRDCVRLNRDSPVVFAIPEDMNQRELRFHILPLQGETLGDGVVRISFKTGEQWESIERRFSDKTAEKSRFISTIDHDDIPTGSDSLRMELKKHASGVFITEPVAILTRGRPRTNPLNIILIDLDTVRADRMGSYGYSERPTTERLDNLMAERGFFVFDRAYSPSPWTLPATAKIFASRYLDFHTGSSVPEHYTLLAEVLRSQGYYCAGFTGGGQLALPGFEQGFHEYHYSKELGKVEDSFPQARRWLESWENGSFFLFLHTYEPHWPYIREHFCGDLPRGRLRNLGVDGRPFPKGIDICTALTRAESLYVQAAYDSGIRHASDAVVEFLGHLNRNNLWKDTVVIILSDHGEEFWDHFPVFASHAHSLYNELLHVPLMIYSPTHSKRGLSHIEGSVSTVDVVPTVYDLLGLSVGGETGPIDGLSLAPYLSDPALISERPMLAAVKSPGLPKICIVENGKKLIKPFGHGRHVIEECRLYPERIEVYDLNEDPDEKFDLSDKHPQWRKSLLSTLDRVQKKSAQPVKHAKADKSELSDELKNQLKRLGYLE